jgi:hypothetical protein
MLVVGYAGLACFLLETFLVLGDPVGVGASGMAWQLGNLKSCRYKSLVAQHSTIITYRLDLELLAGVGLLVRVGQRLPWRLVLDLRPLRCDMLVVVDASSTGLLLQTLFVLGNPVGVCASGMAWQLGNLKPRSISLA